MDQREYWWKKSKAYYVFVFITVILSYGFTLTHYVVGIDDESFEQYFEDGVLIANGRVQSHILKGIIDIFEYMPVWRELLGILLMVVGLMILGHLFYKLSDKRFGIFEETVFACIAVSFPYIACVFIFSMSTISLGLDLCFSAIIIYLFFERDCIKNRIVRIVCLVCAVIIGMLSEQVIVNTGIFFVMALSVSILYTEGGEWDKLKTVIRKSLMALGMLAIGLVSRVSLARIVQKVENVQPVEYTGGYIVYNFDAGIKAFLRQILSILQCWFLEATTNRVVINFRIMAVLLLLAAIYELIRHKHRVFFLLSLGLIAAAMVWLFITGNVNVNGRVLCYMGIAIGFGIALSLHCLLRNPIRFGKPVRIVCAIACFYIIFYQTLDINRVFYEDYMVCERDRRIMERVGEDMKAYDTNEVIFVGYPKDTVGFNAWTGLSSIFWSERENSLTWELYDSRIYRYFGMYGYYLGMPADTSVQEIISEASGMPAYPADGYIKEVDDYILVKLGDAPWEEIRLQKQKAIYGSDEIKSFCDGFAYEDGKLFITGWALLEGVDSGSSDYSVILESEEHTYKLRTRSEVRADVVEAFEGEADYMMSGFTANVALGDYLEAGDYDVSIMIESRGKVYITNLETIAIEN